MRRARFTTVALLTYGALNALVYASLLPLWEGFDEPFHYASVASISRQGRLPRLGKSGVSEEIRVSLELAPASHVVRQNLPGVTTFEDYFRLDESERKRRIAALRSIPQALGGRIQDDGTNYEAQQAPLAYVLLAPFDRAWASAPLTCRIWRLRLICALAGVLGAAWGILVLARMMGLSAPAGQSALFLLLSSQMLYGAAAHVANDWLAVAIMPWLLAAAVAYVQRPSARGAMWMGLALAAGLLAKAYYLALVPLPAVLVWRHRRGWWNFALPVLALAGPWYLRNWLLFGSITGLMDAVTRRGLGEIAGAAARIPWWTVLGASARRALWTANNSFDSFSSATLNALLALSLAAAVCAVAPGRQKRAAAGDGVLLAACALFAAMLAYSTSVLYLSFGTVAFGGAPWYTPAMFGAVFVLLAGGAARAGWAGRAILTAMLAGWGYVIAATWWLKLIPLYGGYRGRVSLPALARWYGQGTMLDATALIPAYAVMVLAGVSAAMALGMAAVLAGELWTAWGEGPRRC